MDQELLPLKPYAFQQKSHLNISSNNSALVAHSHARPHPDILIATRSLTKQCLGAVGESITCADQGVVCAEHHLKDLYLAIQDEEPESTIRWHLKQLQREAAKGKAYAYKIQSRLPQVKALEVVTTWWEELIKVRDEIEQKVKSKEDRSVSASHQVGQNKILGYVGYQGLEDLDTSLFLAILVACKTRLWYTLRLMD
ncbi:hypothetical protein C8J56DRAFT_883932 [Mycena floridula]|nr:hypothetical protein C8J56DRAFT_883932 [Mycena floridula]